MLTDEQLQEIKDYVHQVLDEYNNALGLLFHALIAEVEEGRRQKKELETISQ